MKLKSHLSSKGGFSLVEMLVVIAVIGIIAAIAVPNIGRINDSAKDATYRRNAQNLASVCASAQAAGLDFVGTSTNKTTIIGKVITGASVTDPGPFQNTFFGVPGMNATTAVSATAGAAKYLTVSNGMLQYSGN